MGIRLTLKIQEKMEAKKVSMTLSHLDWTVIDMLLRSIKLNETTQLPLLIEAIQKGPIQERFSEEYHNKKMCKDPNCTYEK